MRQLLQSFVALAVLCAGVASADSLSVVPPSAPGRYDVACSDVTQDFSRLKPGETADEYWEGIPDAGGNPRYVTSLFTSTNPMVVSLRVPMDAELFGAQANRSVTFANIVCYPTEGNARPDYILPNGRAVPHMRQAGQDPLFASGEARFPVLLFSHGLSGSPLSSDYLRAITLLASHGLSLIHISEPTRLLSISYAVF